MIVCKKCGNQNPDTETFCTSCRAFLEWSGEKVVEAPPPAPPPPPAPEPDFIDRVKQAVGLDRPEESLEPTPPTGFAFPPAGAVPNPPTAPPPAVIAASVGTPAAVTSPPPPTAGQPPRVAPPPMPAPPPIAAPVPIAAVAPRAADIPAARVPQAVAPAPELPRQAPKTDVTTGQRYRPGDLICGQCGAGNDPERHFCQRCGANLGAAVVVKTPWYRKLFPARRPVAAGTRPSTAPQQRAWGSAFFRLVVVILVIGFVLAYVAVPPIKTRVNNAVGSLYSTAHRHFAPTTSAVRPSDATASSALTTHPARLSIDLVKETYWAANTATDKQPWLRLVFGGRVDIDQVLVTSGAANDYATLARPKDVKILFSDKSSVSLTLQDSPNPVSYNVMARQVTYAEIHILSVYPSAQSPDVAINEVEFFSVQ